MLSIPSFSLRTVALAALVLAVLGQADAWATFPGRNGAVAVTTWGSIRNDRSSGIGLFDPRSGRLVSSVPVCDYTYGVDTPGSYCDRSGSAALSPDGQKAAVVAREMRCTPSGTTCESAEALRIIPFGGEPQVLPLSQPVAADRWGEGFDGVSWSPSGTELLLERPLSASGGPGLFVAPVTEVNRLRLVAAGSDADWSADGRIVLVRNSNLYVGRVGRPFRQLTHRGGTEPSWSPHGQWLAFVRNGNLYAMRSSGGSPRQITRRGARAPAWSPDGKQIAFFRRGTQFGERVTYFFTVQWKRGRARQIGREPLDNPDQGDGVGSYVESGPDWQALPR